MDSKEGEKERKGARAANVEVLRLKGTPPKHPPISSAGTGGSLRARRLSALFCVFHPASKQQLWLHKKVPKERKCGSCSDFPVPMIKVCAASSKKGNG